MPFAPAQLVIAAVESLDGAHPLAVVTMPALLRAGRRTGVDVSSARVEFGSTEETELLRDFFLLPRPPEPDRPYFAPWSRTSDEVPSWQTKKYPGGGLQRQRTHLANQGLVFSQVKNPPHRDSWGLTPTAGTDLRSRSPHPIRLIDLAIWFGRDVDVDAVASRETAGALRLLDWFMQEFSPRVGDLVGTVFSDEVPDWYVHFEFEDHPVDEGTYEELGSLPPAPTVSQDMAGLVQSLETRLRDNRYVLPDGLVSRVITAWLRGDIVVLVGQPGTGKSLFASLLGRAMEAELDLDTPLVVPVRADFDEAEFIGYERLDGSPEFREFASSILRTDEPLEARVVILEEFNLASIESYLASVLVATQDPDRLVRLPAGEQARLPIDAFIIATCNSYRDEPETRTRVSSPTKRRSTVITMPNVLGDRYEEDPSGAISSLIDEIVAAERDRVSERLRSGASARFDAIRLERLSTVTSADSFSQVTLSTLTQIAASILDTPTGRSWFTMALLRDVVLNLALADRDENAELSALGHSVADKIIHQVRGRSEDVQDLRVAYASLPNADEIDRLVQRMMDGPADELLPLL